MDSDRASIRIERTDAKKSIGLDLPSLCLDMSTDANRGYEPSNLDLHCLHGCLVWCAEMKGFYYIFSCDLLRFLSEL